MLTKLYKLSEYIYEKSKLYNKPLMKDFNIFFNNLIGYHIQYKLKNLSDEDLNKQLDYIRATKYGKKWANIDYEYVFVDEAHRFRKKWDNIEPRENNIDK